MLLRKHTLSVFHSHITKHTNEEERASCLGQFHPEHPCTDIFIVPPFDMSKPSQSGLSEFIVKIFNMCCSLIPGHWADHSVAIDSTFCCREFSCHNRSFSMFTATISILTQALILEFGVSGSTPLGSAREFWELVPIRPHTPSMWVYHWNSSITLRCTLTSSCKQAWTSCLPQELLQHHLTETCYGMYGMCRYCVCACICGVSTWIMCVRMSVCVKGEN